MKGRANSRREGVAMEGVWRKRPVVEQREGKESRNREKGKGKRVRGGVRGKVKVRKRERGKTSQFHAL